jgi:hypothetical protein
VEIQGTFKKQMTEVANNAYVSRSRDPGGGCTRTTDAIFDEYYELGQGGVQQDSVEFSEKKYAKRSRITKREGRCCYEAPMYPSVSLVSR